MSKSQKTPKQKTSSLNTTLTILWTLVAAVVIYFSHDRHEELREYLPYIMDNKFKTTSDKFKSITTLIFCSGLMMFGMMVLSFVLKVFVNVKEGPTLSAIESYLKDSIKAFIITTGIFAYILTHNNFELESHQLALIMLWTIIARVMSAVGYLLTAKTNLNFAEFGLVLETAVNLTMLGQIMGISLFEYI